MKVIFNRNEVASAVDYLITLERAGLPVPVKALRAADIASRIGLDAVLYTDPILSVTIQDAHIVIDVHPDIVAGVLNDSQFLVSRLAPLVSAVFGLLPLVKDAFKEVERRAAERVKLLLGDSND